MVRSSHALDAIISLFLTPTAAQFLVSGGMAGKLSAAAATASRGIPVFIVKGGTEDMIEAGMGNIPNNGTLMRPIDQ